jgi:diguanylate cyclase (GGDEF)-like protein
MIKNSDFRSSGKSLTRYLIDSFLVSTFGFIIVFLIAYFVLSSVLNEKELESEVELTIESIRSNATVAAYSSSAAMAVLALSPLERVPWIVSARLTDTFDDTLHVVTNPGASNGSTASVTAKRYPLSYRGDNAGVLTVNVDYSRGRNLFIDIAIGMISIIVSTTMVSLTNYIFIKRKIVRPIESMAQLVKTPLLPEGDDASEASGPSHSALEDAEAQGDPGGIAEIHAISIQLRRTVSQLSEQATVDPLTGVANRRAFDTALAMAAGRAAGRGDDPSQSAGCEALLLIDIDYFKFINDHFGHLAGDRVLQDLSAYLDRFADAAGTAYRLGGDEFAVLLRGSHDTLLAIIANMKNSFAYRYEQIDNAEIYYSVSVGYALWPDDVADFQDLFFAVSSALMSAKVQGRKSIVRFDRAGDGASLVARLPVREYEDAHREGRVTHYAQPMVSPENGQIEVFELLLRVIPSNGGACVRADLAVEAAIRLGMITDLTRRTLQAACDLLDTLRRKDRGWICVSVNLNEAQLSAPDFLSVFDEVFPAETGAQGLVVEMLEGDYLNSRSLSQALSGLRERRVAFAIDDFGKGYSSMLRLFSMPLSIVKLDQSLLRYREEDTRLLDGMIAALSSGGRRVVVEGVETAEDAAFVRETGARLAQGYFYARPMPMEEAVHAACAMPIRRSIDPLLPAGQKTARLRQGA